MMQVIEEIKDRLDIVAEIGKYVQLTNSGGRWKCFGCGAGGDLFDFFMRSEGWEMGEAIRELGGRAGGALSGSRRMLSEWRSLSELLSSNAMQTKRRANTRRFSVV